jgi:arabinofuranan 3-O-arabinosyltransferase
MATTTSPGTRRARAARWLEVGAVAAVAYGIALRSSPGRVSADSKQYLYLDPGDFLARAPHLWDARAGGGGVSHQHIGYLWPMGPWFWVGDALGLPTWVAQRLWLGTVMLVAALGARWLLRRVGLGRAGVLAGTLVYLLTPYQLAFSARTSILLLPWAGLPWLVGLTDRAQREGGWRDPAWMALLALTIGSVNASSLVLVAVGPLVWLLAGVDGRASARRAVGVVGRTGLLTLGASLWWIAALRLEAAYGLPVLQVTERLESVAATSTPSDVLRGLGNWYFYGRDRLGYSIDQAEHYLRDLGTVGATFALSALGVAAGVVVRWRHRGRFVALVLVGTVVSVGAWPLEDPTPFARAVADLGDTSAGLALRNTARAAPIVVLGLAGLLGAAVTALRPQPLRWGAAGLVGLLAVAGLRPVWSMGLLSDHQDRVDPVPAYWIEAADALGADGTATRVLEVPGSNFAAHRWGNAVDPILPGLMERGQIARGCCRWGRPARCSSSTPSTAACRRARSSPTRSRPWRACCRPVTWCCAPTSSTSASARPTRARCGVRSSPHPSGSRHPCPSAIRRPTRRTLRCRWSTRSSCARHPLPPIRRRSPSSGSRSPRRSCGWRRPTDRSSSPATATASWTPPARAWWTAARSCCSRPRSPAPRWTTRSRRERTSS